MERKEEYKNAGLAVHSVPVVPLLELTASAPVNFLMELCWPSFSFTLRHRQLLSITDILLTVSAIGITLLNTSLAHSQDFQKGGLWDPAWEWVSL